MSKQAVSVPPYVTICRRTESTASPPDCLIRGRADPSDCSDAGRPAIRCSNLSWTERLFILTGVRGLAKGGRVAEEDGRVFHLERRGHRLLAVTSAESQTLPKV